jgi:predicted RecB family nuclease
MEGRRQPIRWIGNILPARGATQGAAGGRGHMAAGEPAAQVRLGAYAARSCAVRAQWDVVRPCEPAPDPPFLIELGRRGIAFEAEVFAELVALHPDAVVIDRSLPRDERERGTMQALAAGARLVIGPRLPHEPASGRVGEPDLLVRAGSGGYVPVDVKHHRTIDAGAGDDRRGVHALAELGHRAITTRPRDAGTTPSERGDLLQLAHYWRLLEDLGLAADGTPTGAIVGRERQVVGYDLTELRLSEGRGGMRRSALDAYDAEFAERRRVVLEASAHVADASHPLPLVPVRITECPECPWRTHCDGLLEARDDVSLLPGVARPGWEALRRIGADTIPVLAALPEATPVDGMTAGAVASAVAQARARIGPEPAYRRPGLDRIRVERADVEVDVDMENVEEGAYLWGALVTDRAGAQLAAAGYHAFVDWDADAAVAGARAFDGFWTWLDALRHGCAAQGLTFRAYCWSAAAENRWLRAGAAGSGREDEVEGFIDSEQWVDLMRVFDTQVITGRARGLKVVAPLLGFAWDDEDPSGTGSMLWWQEAVDPDVPDAQRGAVRQRLLAYNADDVRATLHVREWMDREGSAVRALPDR